MLYEKLNYILTIAEEQNLTRAAKRLFISQPTLTLYLNRLEAELGAKLFDRAKSPITLTDAGRYYLDEMKKIAASEQLLRSGIKLIANPAQSLVVGIGQVRGRHWLPLMLPTFCSIHPDVNIQVVQGTERSNGESLERRALDVVFGVLPPSAAQLEVTELMYEKLFLAAHRKFGLVPARQRGLHGPDRPYTIQPKQLDNLPFIIPQVGNGLYDSYEKVILDNQIHPSRTISVNNLSTGLQLAFKGLGVQLLSGSILQLDRDLIEDMDELDFCEFEEMPQTRKCVAAYHKDSIKINLIQDIIRIVQTEVLPACQCTEIIRQ